MALESSTVTVTGTPIKLSSSGPHPGSVAVAPVDGTIFVDGNSGVTTSDYPIAQGEKLTIDLQGGELWGVSGGSVTVKVLRA